jgi:hypothetical protein
MVNSSPDVLDGLKCLVLPKLTTAVIDTLVAEVGTLVYDTTKNKLSFCIAKAAGAGNWEDVTSA